MNINAKSTMTHHLDLHDKELLSCSEGCVLITLKRLVEAGFIMSSLLCTTSVCELCGYEHVYYSIMQLV